MRRCLTCDADLEGEHHNRRRCAACAGRLLRVPAHGLSDEQQRTVLELQGRCTINEIAAAASASRAAVSRFRKQQGISLRMRRYSKTLRHAVVACYEEHGGPETRRRFPGVLVSSIIDRTPHAPRIRRWSDDEIRMAVSMAGMVPTALQADLFERPCASSIQALWNKRLSTRWRGLHGLRPRHADYLCRRGYPTVANVVCTRDGTENGRRPLLLWCEAGPWLHDWLPQSMHDAVEVMAQFQRWLLRTDDPAADFRAMVAACSPVSGGTLSWREPRRPRPPRTSAHTSRPRP